MIRAQRRVAKTPSCAFWQLALAAVAIALPCAALGATRPLDPPRAVAGTWSVSYYAVSGPDAFPITQREYEDLVRAGSCGPRSNVTVWPRERRVVFACDGG